MGIERDLTENQVFLLFVCLSFIYVFPLIHADYLYIDDQWRSLLLVDADWRRQGRLFAQLLYNALTFTPSMPNIFPLPLMCSMLAIAWAMKRLAFHLYPTVDVYKCLVVLPLLCSPFLLGNLTYQYDGPAMVLAIAASVAALTLKTEHGGLKILVPGLLIALALGLYQLSVSVFVALCCVEVMLRSATKTEDKTPFTTAAPRAAQLLSGLFIYFCSAHAFSESERGKLLKLDAHWLPSIGNRLGVVLEKIGLLNSHSGSWVWAGLLLLAGAGGVYFVRECLANESRLLNKSRVLLVMLLTVIGLLFCVPGVMLFLNENRLDARDLLGFAVLMILLFYLAHKALTRVHPKAAALLLIPCLAMFSLSYLYGQVLNAKKDYEANLSSHIAYDLTSRSELKDVLQVGFSVPAEAEDGYGVPAAQGTLALVPVIGYLLSSDNLPLFPDRFKRLGISNVVWARDALKIAMTINTGTLIVDNRQYRIYRLGNQALIQLQKP